ncbi:MAG: hypothetical protein O7E52_30040 [Candidatus Poribacteria bacterium]|nr:hypothetical protein [Candidatus Poribacteria bacterium]
MEILALHHKLKSVPLKIKKLEKGFQIHQQKLQAKQEELGDAEKEQRSKTAQLDMHQEQRLKFQAQLREVKTNREYQALDKEISFLDAKDAEIEDEILAVMLQIDQLTEELDRQQEELEAEQTKKNQQEALYRQETENLQAQIVAWQEKRRGLFHRIDQGLMVQYLEGFKRKRTGIISLVTSNICNNCHLTIPPQTLKEARKYEQFIRCGSCKHILYIPPPVPDDVSSADATSD